MEQAIKKAIEGGYTSINGQPLTSDQKRFLHMPAVRSKILLDRLFWQALGKSLGWGDLTVSRDDWTQQPKWLYEWKCFIDHLASGKDAESFFTDLIKKI